LSFAQLEARLIADGLRPAHALTLWRALHRDLEADLAMRDDFLPPLRRWIAQNWQNSVTIDNPEVTATIESSDGLTRKLLLRLADGQEIETVVMGYPGRHTVCLSTQAGCAMGCVFCATGQMGFVRHLRPGEIVAQIIHAKRLLRSLGQDDPRNVVLMGMGEPFHNYDSSLAALAILADDRGQHIGPARISVSTVGVVPGILRFAEERQPYHLAVSLHAANDADRSSLVPPNRRWPLADLLDACRFYHKTSGRKVFVGHTLIDGKNDSPAQAAEVAALLHNVHAHVNLIRLNPTGGYDGAASDHAAALAFQRVLRAAGIPSTIRQRRGIDVAAGCGQLRAAK